MKKTTLILSFLFLLSPFFFFAQEFRPERPRIRLMVGDSSTQQTIEIPICVSPDTLLIAPTYKARILGFHIIEFIVDDDNGEKTYFATYDFHWNPIHCLLITLSTDFIQEEYSFYSAIEIKVYSTYYFSRLDRYGMPVPTEVSQKTIKSIEIMENGHFKLMKTEIVH